MYIEYSISFLAIKFDYQQTIKCSLDYYATFGTDENVDRL